ncbi:heterokaryon incompatibility protein-domain-containing protein [Rhexocercosporidium sp. MPI-PUGE-AT-0058]|nr:heterokaryon incompatibility protein-domain-containing protein [Rhexocercosporidium sp. MPI-PUGE-AT-0058]
MNPSFYSSRDGKEPTVPVVLQPDDPIQSGNGQDSEYTSESSSKPAETADVDSDADSDTDARDLIKQLVENAGTEIFELVDEIDSSICPLCVNIICAFSEGSTPVRTPGKASMSFLLHHRLMKALLECSTTCKMCLLILHLLNFGGSDVKILAQALSRNERELVRLLARDQVEFGKTIKRPEKYNWRLRPWTVILDSARAWHEKQHGKPGNVMFRTGVELSIERAAMLLRWARNMDLGTRSDGVKMSSSSSSSGTERKWIPDVDEENETANPRLRPESSTSQEPRDKPRIATDDPPRPTYAAAITESQDSYYMLELLVAARSMKERYRLNAMEYKLEEVRGYKGQPVELQVVYGKETYRARIFTTKDDSTSDKTLGRPISDNAKCSETIDLMKSWFSDCVHNHPECSWSPENSDMDPVLPSRVIDVGDSCTPDFLPRLLTPGSQRGKWATLSHRWGQADILKSIKSNVEELEAGMDVSKLPQTFRDAIFLTRHLGLQYLWVDSLCIIQDSPEDWLKEAASMPNIYRNSCITIAAAATENSTGGIFVDRSWLPTSRPCHLPVQITSAESHGMVYFDVPFDANLDGKEINCLRTRAWCIQESLLSHRLLTFDTLQMSYTCVRHDLVESRDTPHILAREDRNTFLEQFQAGAAALTPGDGATLRRMIITWYDILYDYTRRDLTFSNDKLVAISGIASVVGTCIQDEYFGGLWRHDMPRALLWSPFEEETLPNAPHESRLPPIYRAPSWSWASMDSPISCFLCRERLPNPPIATILEVSTTLVGPDIYGQVSSGYLKIRAPLKHAVVGEKSAAWPEQPLLKLDGWEEGDITHAVFDTTWLDQGTDLLCLQITNAYGLMVVETDGQKHVFSRIGIFHLRSTERSNPEWFLPSDVKTVVII